MTQDYKDKLKARQAAEDEARRHTQQLGVTSGSNARVVESVEKSASVITEAIDHLSGATKAGWKATREDVVALLGRLQHLVVRLDAGDAGRLENGFTAVAAKLEAVAKKIQTVKVEGDQATAHAVAELGRAVAGLELNPVVNVPAPQVVVKPPQVVVEKPDLKPLLTALGAIENGIKALDGKDAVIDNSDVLAGLRSVEKAVRDLIKKPYPVSNYQFPFKDHTGFPIQPDAVVSTSDPSKTGVVALNPDGSDISSGGGGEASVQYEDGASVETPTGNVMMVHNTGDQTAHAISDVYPMPTSLEASGQLDNISAILNNLTWSIMGPDPAIPGLPAYGALATTPISLSAGDDQVLVSAEPGKQIWVYGIGFVVDAGGTVLFHDEDDVAVTGAMPFAADGGMSLGPSGNFAMPMWKLPTDKDLLADVVTSGVNGWITYSLVTAEP